MLLTESHLQATKMPKQRESLIEVMFEDLNFDDLILNQSPYNLAMSEGKETCLIVDIGELNCEISAIFNNTFLSESFLHLGGISGRKINDQLAMDLSEFQNLYFTKSHDREFVVRDIKELACMVAPYEGAGEEFF